METPKTRENNDKKNIVHYADKMIFFVFVLFLLQATVGSIADLFLQTLQDYFI